MKIESRLHPRFKCPKCGVQRLKVKKLAMTEANFFCR